MVRLSVPRFLNKEVSKSVGQKGVILSLAHSARILNTDREIMSQPFISQRTWSRHCATSQKVTGSNPDEVDFFN
jgi:hypothetical protein